MKFPLVSIRFLRIGNHHHIRKIINSHDEITACNKTDNYINIKACVSIPNTIETKLSKLPTSLHAKFTNITIKYYNQHVPLVITV